MNRTVATLLLISLATTPSYAESNKKTKQFFTNLANALESISASKALEKEHGRFEEQRKKLEAAYRDGNISTDKYYEALARIDQNQLEWEKAVSQTAIQAQQTKIQQQRVAVEAQRARQATPLMRVGGGGSKTIYDRSGGVVGYINED